jgi:hypothetical protein
MQPFHKPDDESLKEVYGDPEALLGILTSHGARKVPKTIICKFCRLCVFGDSCEIADECLTNNYNNFNLVAMTADEISKRLEKTLQGL